MNYFKSFEISTLEELKSAYRKLAMQYHPDMGGSTEAMQEINNQYDNLFSKYKNIHKNKDGETYTAREETTEAPEEFRNQIYAGMKNRFMQEGMFIEEITFKQWMQHINELKEVTQ